MARARQRSRIVATRRQGGARELECPNLVFLGSDEFSKPGEIIG